MKDKQIIEAEEIVAKHLKEAFRQELGELSCPTITLEELRALERADRTERNKKRLKRGGGAVVLLILIFAMILLVFNDGPFLPVDAEEKDRGTIIEKDGADFILNSDQADQEQNVERLIENEGSINKLRDLYPDLKVASFIPKGYHFQTLDLVVEGGQIKAADYIYINKKGLEARILQKKEVEISNTTVISEYDMKLDIDSNPLYITSNQEQMNAYYILGDTVIFVSGEITKSEIVKVIKSLS